MQRARLREHCQKILLFGKRNAILTTGMRVRRWMGGRIVGPQDPRGVPEEGVGIGAHRCDLALLAILPATADGSGEQLHEARAGMGRLGVTAKAEEAEVAALAMISAGYKQHR